jgi:hypothetical protein
VRERRNPAGSNDALDRTHLKGLGEIGESPLERKRGTRCATRGYDPGIRNIVAASK